eukprot:1037434-Rhodomonas_salina.2
MGVVSWSLRLGLGQTQSEATEWESETSMRCLTGASVRGTKRVSVTAGERVGSVTDVYSADVGGMSAMGRGNRAGTGSTS